MSDFVHLSVASEYSVVKGIVKIKDLLSSAKSQGMQAIAITDCNNLFAAVKFFKAAVKFGVKPILGCEIVVDFNGIKSRVLIWCQTNQGYRNLSVLLSNLYLNINETIGLVLKLDKVKSNDLTGLLFGLGSHGCLLRADYEAKLQQNYLNTWLTLCPGRVVTCISKLGWEQEQNYNLHILQLSAINKIPVVAVNDVCFLNAGDFNAHEARVCIERSELLLSQDRQQDFTKQQFLKSPAQMQELFAAWPKVIENTVALAKKCNVWFDFDATFLPDFPVPNNDSIDIYFKAMSKQGLANRLADDLSEVDKVDDYWQRLAMECDVIVQMGFCGYFLIVADFIAWSKANGVPVGPGRGSGAGSLVAYVLGITDVDPLEYGLLFERFLNPERVSMPDFDIDFCMEGRDRVIEYVSQRYGKQNVSQIITFGTMAARAVVRDVGRVLNHPYGFVDKLAKLVPTDLGMTLMKALDQEPVLAQRYREENEVNELIDLALKLEGVVRGVGKHAGGVVIAPKPLYEFTPVYYDNVSILSQFDKDDIESIGLVKFDFLGLRTLTIIDWTEKWIRSRYAAQQDFSIRKIQLNDANTFKMLQECKTNAVFQLESRGMKDLIKRLKPDHFEEIVALVALFRPGPLQSGMVDDFIETKHGRMQVRYLHPCLESILKTTNGVILYQEQVMQIAQTLSGYTLGGADLLRRAMGKKKPEEMAKQREVFVKGAADNGHDVNLAKTIFDLIEKFAGYGFNKSHSVAYAMLSYQTAWLKANYPAEFMASALSADMDNTDKVLLLLDSCVYLELKVLPPDINLGEYKFLVLEDKVLGYGLGAIKGVGETFVNALVAERQANGKFENLCDLVKRLHKHKINRKILECLVKSGAVDAIIPHRNAGILAIDLALSQADQQLRDVECGQISLFGQLAVEFSYPAVNKWNAFELLHYERSVLGLYLSGHPLSSLRKLLKLAGAVAINEVSASKSICVAGLITAIKTIQGKRGQTMGFVSLEDETGSIDLALFGDSYHNFRDTLVKDKIVIVRGGVSIDQFNQGFRLQVDWLRCWQEHLEYGVESCCVYLDIVNVEQALSKLVVLCKQVESGSTKLIFDYSGVKIMSGKDWRVKFSADLWQKLAKTNGVQQVKPSFSAL